VTNPNPTPSYLKIVAANQKLEETDIVELYTLDGSKFGDPSNIFYFCNTTDAGGIVTFDAIEYAAVPVETDGWQVTGQGSLPQPKIRISNLGGIFSGLSRDYNDLKGWTVIRKRTYARFLDGHVDADPLAFFYPVDVYVVDKKTAQNKIQIEFELAAAMDQQGRYIPGRIALRDYCTHDYRFWTGTDFSYVDVTCPYTDAVYFDANGNEITDPSKDVCSKRFQSGCRRRFGGDPLPFQGFPGLAKIRVTSG